MENPDGSFAQVMGAAVMPRCDPQAICRLAGTSAHATDAIKEALVRDGIPFTSFAVDDVHAEYARLKSKGVRFTQPPVEMGPVTTAVLDDTCGNLIQLAMQR